ncbi:hypothetical protein EDC04DRAFT_217675 [Pisolithus marmoratus]|nr:hypothetical protein EDC04DRAFT_217675 [Pisolithus marmoratus]
MKSTMLCVASSIMLAFLFLTVTCFQVLQMKGPASVCQPGIPGRILPSSGTFFACVQNLGDNEPTWLRGPCVISKSPVMHSGDRTRLLLNSLAESDLDGDMYEVVQYGPLLDLKPQEPAAPSCDSVHAQKAEHSK